MNKVYQINIVEADNGFIVQSEGHQHVAKDDEEVKKLVNDITKTLLEKPVEKPTQGQQTVKRFADSQQTA